MNCGDAHGTARPLDPAKLPAVGMAPGLMHVATKGRLTRSGSQRAVKADLVLPDPRYKFSRVGCSCYAVGMRCWASGTSSLRPAGRLELGGSLPSTRTS